MGQDLRKGHIIMQVINPLRIPDNPVYEVVRSYLKAMDPKASS